MGSTFLVALLLTSTILSTATATAAPYTTAPQPNYKEKITYVNFLYRENYSGPNVTVEVVLPALNDYSYFGVLSVSDSELTRAPQATLEQLVGRAQGFSVGTSMADFSLFYTSNIVFKGGLYKGSTLTVVGKIGIGVKFVLSIIAGTGQFKLAKGYLDFIPLTPPPPAGTVPTRPQIYQVEGVVIHC